MRLAVVFVTGPLKVYVEMGSLLNEDIIFMADNHNHSNNLKDGVPANK
tara:strand:- start:3742 stop:3885 length:144 start_codon:yes stop_codon:yes gene_type:complete